MKNRFFLMISLCLISNIAYSMDKEPDLSSYESIDLTEDNKNKFQIFLKVQFVQQGGLPDNADLSLETFVLDKGHQHQQLGQRYIVKVVAKWLTYDKVYENDEDGIFVLRPQQHGRDIYSYIFDSGLRAAGVNLPK